MELLLLGGKIAVLKIQELAAEKSDAARVVEQHGADVVDSADVGVDVDFSAVNGDVLLALELLKKALFLLVGSALCGVLGDCRLVRVDYHGACVAVHYRRSSGGYLGQELIAHAYYSRNIHVPGKYGGVGIRRAVRRNERKNLVLVERHGLTGSEVVRAYYHAVAGLSGTVRSAGEVSDYAIGDIPDIG